MSFPWRHERFQPGEWVVFGERVGRVIKTVSRKLLDYGDGNAYTGFYQVEVGDETAVVMGTVMQRISLLDVLAMGIT